MSRSLILKDDFIPSVALGERMENIDDNVLGDQKRAALPFRACLASQIEPGAARPHQNNAKKKAQRKNAGPNFISIS